MNIEEYEALIREVSMSFSFQKIDGDLNEEDILSGEGRVCFLRHDIDYSPENALEMARLEHRLKVKSTFTVLLSGQYYNPFESKTKNILNKIANYGHEVGLHFDPTCYDIQSEDDLGEFVSREAKILEDLLGVKVSMFSFHNTTPFSMSCRSKRYGGILNAYSSFFHDEVEYTSDSNGYWRFRSWQDLLSEDHKVIQILTHPIWWQPNNSYLPFETVVKNIIERADAAIDDYTRLFDGQSVRINYSEINEWLMENGLVNDSEILNDYARSRCLLEVLRSNDGSVNRFNIEEAARDFLRK